eukprot:gnl/TRDRNA2_/TRDRNA2_125468_c0_seq1.p1 gnl/TRDRNA2_/TRDRNA2_125468_c0~~gnl/TRDRNA2_/TRDRNA2_125468_c0_seq1.p1  ORF type:complete len:240 (-),score=39.93 gnl/TRDRNA2_/TRDRNA2_125468_c0_seq1:181-900(-)
MLVYRPDSVYHADELFVVAGLNEHADFPASETVTLVRVALGSTILPSGAGPVMVIIERLGTERRLANISEVEEAMWAVAPCGFEVVRVALETLAVKEQLQLAARCRFLIGTEGAGLGYALCVPDGATVVNVLPTRSRFGPLPSQHGYGYFHHLCAQRSGDVRYRAISAPDFDWDSLDVLCPMRALCTVLDEWTAEDMVARLFYLGKNSLYTDLPTHMRHEAHDEAASLKGHNGAESFCK